MQRFIENLEHISLSNFMEVTCAPATYKPGLKQPLGFPARAFPIVLPAIGLHKLTYDFIKSGPGPRNALLCLRIQASRELGQGFDGAFPRL